MTTRPSLKLLDLNADCLGAIYSLLGTKEDRMSFFHTCKDLHGILRCKVYKLVLHVEEEGSDLDELEGRRELSGQEQPLSVDDALRTFPGAVLRSIKLVRPIPREWRSLDGPLQHAEHVAELDVAQSANDKPLDLATLCRLFPDLTSLRIWDKWSMMGRESLRPLQHLKHLKQLTLLQPYSRLYDPPEDLELIFATCLRLESLTLTFLPLCGKDVRLHSRSLKHICISHMHAIALCDLCWHLEHDAFPNLKSITFGEALILCDLEHLKGSAAKMKLGARLFATSLVHVPDTITVLGSSRSDSISCRDWLSGVKELAPFYTNAFSALIDGGITQVVQNVSSLRLEGMELSYCAIVSLLGQAFANVRQLTLCLHNHMSEKDIIHILAVFPLLCCLKLELEPELHPSLLEEQDVLSFLIHGAGKRESLCGLHLVLPDNCALRKTVDKVVEKRAHCGNLGCVTIGFSSI